MTVLKELQARVHTLTGGFFANWLPPDRVEVGDYGVIRGERFQRDGNLRTWNITCETETTKKSAGRLEYSDRAQLRAGAALKGTTRVASQGSPKASARIDFTGEGAFLYHLAGITSSRLVDSRAFFEQLACKWLAGEVRLGEATIIVNEIRAADKATIIVSQGREGSLELRGDFSMGGQPFLASGDGQLSASASSGSLFQWLAESGTIPIIGLVRPVMGPPPGGNASPGGMAEFLNRLRGLFKEKVWDVRNINLRGFSTGPGVATVTAELPNGELVVVGFHDLTMADFLALNDFEREPQENQMRHKPQLPGRMNDLMLQFLQDIYYAERQILKMLRRMAKAAENEELKHAIMYHREETRGQVDRLQWAFEALGKRARGQTCEAINGLIEESEEIIEEYELGSVRDAGILACLQAIQHYELARYGTIVAWARAVGADDVVRLMQQTLEEEKKEEATFSRLAEKNHYRPDREAVRQAS